jgi:Retroviral aspartyl protease/DNA N-6-adenine-methyltransferase (Dam)
VLVDVVHVPLEMHKCTQPYSDCSPSMCVHTSTLEQMVVNVGLSSASAPHSEVLSTGQAASTLGVQKKGLDPEDWQFSPFEFASLNQEYGPVTLECCVDDLGHNALTGNFVRKSDNFLKTDCSGKMVWLNPPFQTAGKFLEHYLECKSRAVETTGALIVLPYWPRKSWWHLTQGFKQVRKYGTGFHLFSVPSQNACGRQVVGPLKWPVCVFYDPPLSRQSSSASKACTSLTGLQDASTDLVKLALGKLVAEVATLVNVDQLPLGAGNFVLTDARLCQLSSTKASQLIILEGYIAGHTIRVLVDSGAQISIVSKQLVDKHSLQTTFSPLVAAVKLADGTKRAVGNVVPGVKIRLGSFCCKHECLVLDNLSFDVILGMDWLSKHNPIIDWGLKSVTMMDGSRGSIRLPLSFGNVQGDTSTIEVQVITAESAGRSIANGETYFLASVMPMGDPPDDLHPDDVPFGDAPQFVGGDQQFKDKVDKVLYQYKGVFKAPEGLPPTRFGSDFKIELQPGVEAVWGPVYRMSPAELKEVQKQLEELMNKGWIQPSESPFGAPILFVRKKDGTLRMCVDYRRLN